MASIWKRDRSPFYYACYTTADGRQLKKSTRFADRDKAMTFALELERAESMGREGTATEARFRSLLSEVLERVTGGEESLRSQSVRAYLTGWVESKEIAESSGERYQHTVDLFLEHLGKRADKPLTSVTPSLIQSFATARRRAGVAPKTLVIDIKILGIAFNRAKRQNLIPHNPVEAVELPKVKSAERDVFTQAQIKLLLGAAPSTDWKTVIMIGYFIGARLRDCANMLLDGVNLVRGTLRFTPLKTGKSIEVPLHPELEAHLQTIMSSDAPQKYLAPSLAERKTGGAHGLSERFKAIMRDAGVDCGLAESHGKRKLSKLTFHSLRHTFNSALANSGVNQELRMKLTGHASEAMNTGYTHHELATLKTALEKLPSLSDRKETKKGKRK